ncbi:MAG: sulfatase family protein [Promethearchaeota archaeon]
MSPEKPEKMNVLSIMMDGHRADHMSCAGNPVVKTPNLDRLAASGVRFSNYFCANGICMPNRASLLTGLYPNAHGVRSNGMILNPELPTLTGTLARRGWRTAAVGKIHHQFWMAPFKRGVYSAEDISTWTKDDPKAPVRGRFPLPYYGYEEVEVVIGNGSICTGHYIDWLEARDPREARHVNELCANFDNLFNLTCDGVPAEYYSSTYVKERTMAFLERFAGGEYERAGKQAFYLHCSFPDPHYPVAPPEEFTSRYKPVDVDLPASFHHAKELHDHEYLGQHLKKPPFKRAFIRETNEEEAREFIAATYAAVAYVDACIGEILKALERLGLADNTIVVYSSDHGDLMGDHGLLFKGPSPFAGVLRIPLIWRVPGVTPRGAVSDALISSVDYPETLLALLGVRKKFHPPGMQGVDATAVLRDPSGDARVRDACFIEADEEVGPLVSRLRHLVTEDFKLTIYEGHEGFGDLYDRKDDPHELTNLWNEPDMRETRAKLVQKMLHEMVRVQSRFPERIAGS